MLSSQKISSREGGLLAIGTLDAGDLFGSITSLGDLDGDKTTDIAVGALGDDDGATDTGAVYILFLNADGTVKKQQKISDWYGNFSGVLESGDLFGVSVSNLGDINGDSITDIAVGALRDDDGGQSSNRGAVYILFLNTDGTVQKHQKISDTQGNFSGSLADSDFFGSSVSRLGDLNNDGIPELAVGAFWDDDGGTASNRGAVWILFLNADGTVQSEQKISSTEGNFSGSLTDGDRFGYSVSNLGDLNSDGIPDIAVGAIYDDDGGTNESGAVWILFLNADGTVQSEQKISNTEGNFSGNLQWNDIFGVSVCVLGDFNSDGIPDIAVGAPGDDGNSTDVNNNRGAVWILFLNADGTVQSEQKISSSQGNFSGNLLAEKNMFGASVARLDDTNRDGIPVIAVGATGDNSARGAVWILFLQSDSPARPTTTVATNAASASTATYEPAGVGTTVSTGPQQPILQPSLADSNANGLDALVGILVVLAVVCLSAALLGLVLLRRRLVKISLASLDNLNVTTESTTDAWTELKSRGPTTAGSALQTPSSDAPIVSTKLAIDGAAGAATILMKASTPIQDCHDEVFTPALNQQSKSESAPKANSETEGRDSATERLDCVEFFPAGSSKEVLGRGKFGKVYLAKWQGQEIAVKQVSSGVAEDLKQEITVLAQLNHPCIVRYFGLVDLDSEFGDGTTGIALEFCVHGSLDQALRKMRFSTTQFLEMSCQTARGLSYLAGRGILHRDLAARNILLDRAFQCKLTDFGLARVGFADNDIYQASSLIPVRWSAPETLTDQSYSLKSDVYSLAITVTEIWSYGEMPFAHLTSNNSVIAAIVNGKRPHRPAGMPPAVFSELQKCWAMEARDRPSARDFAAVLERIAEKARIQADTYADADLFFEIDENSSNYLNPPASFADFRLS